MAVHNFLFPVLAGQEANAVKFAEEALGSHRDHYNSLMAASGTTRVSWTRSETPAGTFVLVWFEADDPQEIFGILASSNDADAVWMRTRIKEIGGVDMTTDWPPPGPPPEPILEWPA